MLIYFVIWLVLLKFEGDSTGTSGEIKSDAWRGKRWMGIEMFFGTLVWIFTPHLVFYV